MKLAEAYASWTPKFWDHPSVGNIFIGPKEYVTAKKDAGEAKSWVHIVSGDFGAEMLKGAAGEWQAKALMMTFFHTVVVRDGIPLEAAHKAFLVIDEYRSLISRDIEGADDGDEE